MSRLRIALDFNCSPRLAGALDALYGHHGFEFVHIERLVASTTRDESWADIFKKYGGRIVISGDSKIAYKPHEAVAFIDNGFVSFFPGEDWCHLKGHERSAFLIHAWPAIQEKIGESNFGTCWRIPCLIQNEELRLPKAMQLQPLRIPLDVLEKARAHA